MVSYKLKKGLFLLLTIIAVPMGLVLIYNDAYLPSKYGSYQDYIFQSFDGNTTDTVTFVVETNNSYLFTFSAEQELPESSPIYAHIQVTFDITDGINTWQVVVSDADEEVYEGEDTYDYRSVDWEYNASMNGVLSFTITMNEGDTWYIDVFRNVPAPLLHSVIPADFDLMAVTYLIFYILISSCLGCGYRSGKLAEKVQISNTGRNSILFNQPAPMNTVIDQCHLCHQPWNPAYFVHKELGTANGLFRAGPFCPDCWMKLKSDFTNTFFVSNKVIWVILILNALTVGLVSFFISPAIGSLTATILMISVVIASIFLILPFPSPLEHTALEYHYPEIAKANFNDPNARSQPIMCRHHPHMRAIGSCPVCGDFYCVLCVLFFNLKSALPSTSLPKLAQNFQQTGGIADGPESALAHGIIGIMSHSQLPEADLSNPTIRTQFDQVKASFPDTLREFYTLAVHHLLTSIFHGYEPVAVDFSPFVLKCLYHAPGRQELVIRQEKSNRGLFLIIGSALPAILMAILFPLSVEYEGLPMMGYILLGMLILIYLLMRKPPALAKKVPLPETEYEERLDQFLLYLDEFIYSHQASSPNTNMPPV